MIIDGKILRTAHMRQARYITKLLTSFRNFILPVCLHFSIVFFAVYSSELVPPISPAGFLNPNIGSNPFIEKLIKWDAHWYTYIAEHGYDSNNIVFFPVLIFLIKFIVLLGIDYGTAGFILANFFAVISFYVMTLVLRLDYTTLQTRRALIAYAVMPMSFFLNSIYTEPLFIVFSLASIYFTRIRKWWLAAIFITLSALTRNLGIFLLIYALFELYQVNQQRPLSRSALLPFILPLVGLGMFMFYNYRLTGNPIAFIQAQQGWGRQFGTPWSNIWRNIQLIYNTFPYTDIAILLDAILTLLILSSLLYLSLSPKFKIRTSYLVIGWLWLMIPLCSTSPLLPLYSLSRFVLIIFPFYIFIAQLRPLHYYCYIFLSPLLLLICTMLFVNWYWLG